MVVSARWLSLPASRLPACCLFAIHFIRPRNQKTLELTISKPSMFPVYSCRVIATHLGLPKSLLLICQPLGGRSLPFGYPGHGMIWPAEMGPSLRRLPSGWPTLLDHYEESLVEILSGQSGGMSLGLRVSNSVRAVSGNRVRTRMAASRGPIAAIARE